MDPAKIEFLFDRVPDGFDVENADDRAELLASGDDHPVEAARSAVRVAVAEQIVRDDPPAVWATAQRLLALGLDPESVLGQLAIALATTALAAGDGDDDEDEDEDEDDEDDVLSTERYEAALAALPLPTPAEVTAAALDTVATSPFVSLADLDAGILTRLGRSPADPMATSIVNQVLDRLLDDGPIALLAGDRVVDVGALTGAVVLTHRLSEAECATGALFVDFDLAGFARRPEPRLADGTDLLPVDLGDGLAWEGPAGWLAGYEPGTLVAVRADPAGAVTLEAVGEEPAPDSSLVDLVRAVYDEEVAEPWLPVRGEDLVLGVLVARSGAFDQPQLPLDDLCAGAGLERRGDEVAHDDTVWATRRKLRRAHTVYDSLDTEKQRTAAFEALDLAESDDASPDDLRRVLAGLQDMIVARVVLDELLPEQAERFSEALLAAATTPRQVGVARWVAAIVAEEAGEVEVAEAHLHLGLEADPASGPLVERCAWYASDRGRAREALVLWQRLGEGHEDDIEAVEPFARRQGPKLGRNEPCWCGSGRKFKSCHPGQQPVTPLPDRVGWLCRKAAAYLRHGGPMAAELAMELASYRAEGSDSDSLIDALDDPIVIDAALTEGGWFADFVDDRSALLPDDEQLLAQSWLLVPRTVYEVVEVTAGAGLRARDLRTGDVLDVRERTFSLDAEPGTMVCARAVPDGETNQFVGAVFPVAPGTEAKVLALCEQEDPGALCAHVGSLHRPPVLSTREQELMVVCHAVLEVPDAPSAAAVLDRHYRRDGELWVEMFALNDDEEVVRATLTLEGNLLDIRTHSEPRLDRVLALLRLELPGARTVRERRTPLAPGEMPVPPRLPASGSPPGPADMAGLQDMFERRWVDESVPALAGLTPRQAAADPTRRDELRRLIASFPDAGDVPGTLAMRPARLRELLGL